MKTLVLSTLMAISLILAATTRAAIPEDLRKSFMLRYDDANAQRDEQLKKLESGYLGALERQRDILKSTGKIEAVIPIHNEIEMVKRHQDPLPRLPDSASSEFKQMRGKYVEHRDKILKTHAETLAGFFGKFEEAIKTQEIELTKAGKIDDAIAAKEMRETLAASVGIDSARELLKQGGLPGNARAALRLRRSGDNLEVLVFHDRSGKISMNSPIKNVREESGEKKELGDTKAKVLGEFVGAKGYDVDIFVAFHQVFDGADPGNFPLNAILAKFRFEVEKQKGVRLSLLPKGVNPCGSFACDLPPRSKGTYRISTRYFVPKSNRAISGFIFVHGGGGAIGGKVFGDVGKWAFGEITTESSNDSPTMLFYLNIAKGINPADATDDYLVLGEIKVEHTKFAAYLKSKFGNNGETVENTDDPLKQALFISNGAFVEN